MSKYLKALTHGTIQEVIRLAEERRIEAGDEDVESFSGLGFSADYLERMAAAEWKARKALYDRILSLPEDQKDELLALMRVGRGRADETVERWSDLLQDARDEDESKAYTILAKSRLGTYLTDGLKRLGE